MITSAFGQNHERSGGDIDTPFLAIGKIKERNRGGIAHRVNLHGILAAMKGPAVKLDIN